MKNPFNKLLLTTLVSASVAAHVYGAADGSGDITIDQRATAGAEQTAQGSVTAPGAAQASLNSTQRMAADAAAQARGALHGNDASQSVSGTITSTLSAATRNTVNAGGNGVAPGTSGPDDGSESDVSPAGDPAQSAQSLATDLQQGASTSVQGAAASTGALAGNAATTGTDMGANAQAGLAALTQTGLSAVATAPVADTASSALPVIDAGESTLPAPELTVNSQARGNVSSDAALGVGAQGIGAHSRHGIEADTGFNGAGSAAANIAAGSATGASIGGVTTGVNILGSAGSLLR